MPSLPNNSVGEALGTEGAMKMHVLPLSMMLLPHAGFFEPLHLWDPVTVQTLYESHITHDGDIVAEQPYMR